MSVNAGQYFPLSVLFELLQVDGKERILPTLRQIEQVPAQLAEMDAENGDLKRMCQEADGLLERRQLEAANARQVVDKLLDERNQLEEKVADMQRRMTEMAARLSETRPQEQSAIRKEEQEDGNDGIPAETADK